MVSILPRKNGFPQRHNRDPKPTPYLTGLIDPLEYKGLSRSSVTMSLIREDVLKFRNATSRPNDLNLRLAISSAYSAFKLPNKVKMVHLNDVFLKKELNIWTSSPGLPWTTYGKKTKADLNNPRDIQSIRWFWHKIKKGDKVYPPDSCAFVRSHIVENGEDKVRAVWGYPATITFGEAVFALPLIKGFNNNKTPIAYKYDTATGGAAKVTKEISPFKWGVALDFKAFDKTVPAWLVDVAFEILAVNIDFVNYEERGTANASRMYRMYEFIQDYFVNTPIRLCNGDRFRKHSGVASGSYFTQLIDSVANYILVVWAYLNQTGGYPSYIKVFGDDSICGSNEWFDLDSAADLFESIGMCVNREKSMVTTRHRNLKFLGFELNLGLPTKDTKAWFTALMFPERKDECWDDVATRALGLLHASAGLDYKFDRVCRAILGVRPYELKWTKSLVKHLANIGIDYIKLNARPPDWLDLAIRIKAF